MHGEHQHPRRSNPGSRPESVPTSSWARTPSLHAGARNNVKIAQESTEEVKGEHSCTGRHGGDPEQQHRSMAGSEQQYAGASTASGMFAQPAHPLIFNTLDPAITILHCTSSPGKDFSPPSASDPLLGWMVLP